MPREGAADRVISAGAPVRQDRLHEVGGDIRPVEDLQIMAFRAHRESAVPLAQASRRG